MLQNKQVTVKKTEGMAVENAALPSKNKITF